MDQIVNHEKDNFGESFDYRGYECRITYNGIRPHFTINGENAENLIKGFEVTPESVGQSGWRYTLMEQIDEYDGIDTESDDYIEPQTREVIRRFTRRYLEYIATHEESWSKAVDVFERTDSKTIAIYTWIKDEMTRLLVEEDVNGFDERRLEAYENSLDEFL